MTKWKCPRCERWVKEPVGKVCEDCHEAITHKTHGYADDPRNDWLNQCLAPMSKEFNDWMKAQLEKAS